MILPNNKIRVKYLPAIQSVGYYYALYKSEYTFIRMFCFFFFFLYEHKQNKNRSTMKIHRKTLTECLNGLDRTNYYQRERPHLNNFFFIVSEKKTDFRTHRPPAFGFINRHRTVANRYNTIKHHRPRGNKYRLKFKIIKSFFFSFICFFLFRIGGYLAIISPAVPVRPKRTTFIGNSTIIALQYYVWFSFEKTDIRRHCYKTKFTDTIGTTFILIYFP